MLEGFQSPSRWGRCCMDLQDDTPICQEYLSVAFQSPSRWGRCCIICATGNDHSRSPCLCFSPLLDGDGLASAVTRSLSLAVTLFQSPSRWGWSCIQLRSHRWKRVPVGVSVPFSMGMVLHLGVLPLYPFDRFLKVFQSPSRWGMVLHAIIEIERRLTNIRCVLFSVPFSMGDGVACKSACIGVKRRRNHSGFSPLLDGGRCCILGRVGRGFG